jgi:hypothetical protein
MEQTMMKCIFLEKRNIFHKINERAPASPMQHASLYLLHLTTIMSRPCLAHGKLGITSQSTGKVNNVFIHYKLNQLLNCHPCVAKISIVMISKRRHACCNALRSSSF